MNGLDDYLELAVREILGNLDSLAEWLVWCEMQEDLTTEYAPHRWMWE